MNPDETQNPTAPEEQNGATGGVNAPTGDAGQQMPTPPTSGDDGTPAAPEAPSEPTGEQGGEGAAPEMPLGQNEEDKGDGAKW